MKRILIFISLFFITTSFAQTKIEKDFFDLTNLVRTNPKSFSKLIQNMLSNGELYRFDKDSVKSLIITLNSLPILDSLLFDSTIYINKKSNLDSVNDKTTHDHNFLDEFNYTENIVYASGGRLDAVIYLVTILIDRGCYVGIYEYIYTKSIDGKKILIGSTIEPSLTHKLHFDNIVGDYKRSAVVSLFDGSGFRIFQIFK